MRLSAQTFRPRSLASAALSVAPIALASIAAAWMFGPSIALGVAVLGALFVLMYWSHRWKDNLSGVLERHHRETTALIQFAAMDLPMRLPFTAMSMRPEDLQAVCDRLTARSLGTVVELGSGVSTLVLADRLRTLGRGRLVSIEHDDAWAALMQRLVESNGLSDHCSVIHAPLSADGSWAPASGWYDRGVLDRVFGSSTVAFLLVDGPPRSTGPWARYPALPYFVSKLEEGGEVVLDDIDREDELAIARRWIAEFPVQQMRVKGGDHPRICVLRKVSPSV